MKIKLRHFNDVPNDGNATDGDGNYQKGLKCKRGQSSFPPSSIQLQKKIFRGIKATNSHKQ
jgi:hypothetical protein